MQLKCVDMNLDFSFSYDDSQKLFDNFKLDIRSGESICILGSNGCGKSSLASILLSLYPINGTFRIDGKERDGRAWRRNVGYVGQEVQILSGTIKDNLQYGA